MVRVSGKIRRLLLDAGLVSDRDWDDARGKGGRVLETLLTSGVLEEDAFLETLGNEAGVAPVDLSRITPDPASLELLPQETCQEFTVLPISRNGDILTIAVGDPFDVLLLDDLKPRFGSEAVLSWAGRRSWLRRDERSKTLRHR
jgi:type IV pilus assembly protein PilB